MICSLKILNQPLHYRRWLLSSTAGHNECIMLELSGNWEPPDSLYAARLCAVMDSLFSLPSGDQSKTQTYGKKIKFSLGFSNGLIVPNQGRSGGLALFWSTDVNFEIKSYSQYHIDATITEQDNNFIWRFTGFYGHPVSNLRKDSWKLLSYLNSQFSLPWFCCGDFNEILSVTEKSGGP